MNCIKVFVLVSIIQQQKLIKLISSSLFDAVLSSRLEV